MASNFSVLSAEVPSSREFQQSKTAAKEMDQKIIQLSELIKNRGSRIDEEIRIPFLFISKFEFDEECGWHPSDKIHWPKALIASPLVALYYTLAAPFVIYDLITKCYAERKLEQTLEVQKRTPDPRLAFGKLNQLMKHPEQLEAAVKQGLAPQEFVDFVKKNLETYKELKSLPSSRPWKHHEQGAHRWLIRHREKGLAPIEEEFEQLQRALYRVYAENKIQKLSREILQKNPDQGDLAAREEAIKTLHQKYEKTKPGMICFSRTRKEYKSCKMLEALEKDLE